VPKGDIGARIDLSLLGGTENPAVDAFVRQIGSGAGFLLRIFGAAIPGVDAGQVAGNLDAWLREVVDSGKHLDLLMDLDDAWLRMEAVYAAKEGTRLAEGASAASGVGALAAHVPEGWPYVVLFRLDPAWIAGVAGVPELDRVLRGLRGEWLLAGTFEGDGPRFVIAARAKDGPAAGAALASLLASAVAGIDLVCTREQLDAKGAFATRLRLTPGAEATSDRAEGMAAVLGPEGFPVEIVAREDLLLIAGGEEGIAPRLLGSTRPPAALAEKLPPPGENLHLFVGMDVGRALDGIRRMMTSLPGGDDLAMPPLEGAVELYGTSSGRTWKWGLRIDEGYLRSIRTLGMSRLGGPPRPPR
jgi:hypothetical protein